MRKPGKSSKPTKPVEHPDAAPICTCRRCDYQWEPLYSTMGGEVILPRVCPRCKSYQWQTPSSRPKRKGKK